MVTTFALGITEIIACACRHCPPVGIALIVPERITLIGGETKYHFVAGIVVPVESGIPAIGNLIRPIYTVYNILSHFLAIGISFFADIYSGVEI